MRLNFRRGMLLCTLIGSVNCSSSQEPSSLRASETSAEESGGPSLRMTKTSRSGVRVAFVVGSKPPRMADVRLKARNARYVSASPGNATSAAGKVLNAQPTQDGARFVIFSSANVNTIGSGELFEAVFEPTGDGPVTLEILTDEPIMAPAEAAQGLIVGDPITL